MQAISPSVLQRIASGEAAAVRECIDTYGALVWSLARRLSRTPSDAEDATQEIFLDIWRSAGRFDSSQGSDKVFIAMIARRRLIDRLRKTSSEPAMDPVEVLETVAWSDPGTASEISLEAEQAARALKELRPEQRQVLELGLLQGLSQTEISTRLGMPLGTVKSFMRRGLIKVREFLNVGGKGVSEEV
jgi:RNA polymerase sigma-70 factor, ECF subfamily